MNRVGDPDVRLDRARRGARRRTSSIGSLTAERSATGDPLVVAKVHNSGERTLDISGNLTLGGPAGFAPGRFRLTPEGLEQTLSVTLLGAFHVCQAGARAMVERGDAGSLTVIGSIHGESGFSNSTSYNVAKFGLTGMVLTAANELARHNIRVNLVNPGWIDTPGERRYATEDELRAEAQKLPFRRLGQPHEIGRVVAFLASDAASFVSGAVLRADGAQIAALGG